MVERVVFALEGFYRNKTMLLETLVFSLPSTFL